MSNVIVNPVTLSLPDSTTVAGENIGKAGEMLASELHGKYYTAGYRGTTFGFSVAAATLPVNAASLASKMTLYNPPGSGKNLELIHLDWSYVLATTAVNGVGVYYSTVAQTAAGTFTTATTSQALNLAAPVGSVAIPYSAYTASGTPVLIALCGYTGAVTSTAANVNQYMFDGKVIVPPGYSIHVAMTTAASTGSGFTGMISWAEWPI